MKISARTLEVLKNCSGYNTSIHIEPGERVRALSPSGEVIIDAKIEETIPVELSIAELGRFLGAVSLFKSPDIIFNEDDLIIKEGSTSIKYRYSSKKAVSAAPYDPLEEVIDMGDEIFSFDINQDTLNGLTKAAQVMELHDICISSDGDTLKVSAIRRKDKDLTDSHDIVIGPCDKKFKVFLNQANMKLLPANYKVTVYEDLAEFAAGTDLRYLISYEV